MQEKPVLQVALDMENIERAIEIAAGAVAGGADWVEAGTPLIKSHGLDAVRTLKKKFRDKVIVADMKTMDVGGFEVEIAAKAGADVVCVLGVADDATIAEAVKAGRKYGTKIMLDLLGVENKKKRIADAAELGVHFICLHLGIDQQMSARSVFDELREVVKVSPVPVAVAGGINSETAAEAVNAGASIIIVGSAIIKAKDVKNAAATIKKAMLSGMPQQTEDFRKYSETQLFEAFSKVSTPNISDAMHRKGAMKGIKPFINRNRKMVGRALTVRTIDGDWAKPVEAIDRANKGDVLVIDAGGGTTAVWGELASWSCKVKGVAGVVIDGAARDIDTILNIDFPVFARHIVPCAGEPKGFGEIGVEVVCGGQVVSTGDWVIGDESGVVVVPQKDAVQIANRAVEVLERENRLREEIKQGGTLSSIQKLERWEKVG
ncbi:MAG: orotidine 5'-phosphate decarboxylase [Thermoplasmata archaeon]|nr:orotidine 5'-phosphate decarboxylase [Thermoplasmata archaeon]